MSPVTPRNTNTSTEAPDPTIETQVIWMKYKTPIIATLLAVIVAGAAFGAYTLYSNHRDEAAAAQLAQAKDAAGFQKVMNDYSGTPAGASAALFLASEQSKAKQFAEANATLQKFIADHPKHELVTTAQMAMAGNLDSSGKADEALAQYQKVASEHPRDFNAPIALLAQVPLYKAKGQIEQARQVCETILSQYHQSEVSGEASRYLRTLKTPAAAATPQPAAAAATANPAPAATAAPNASVATSAAAAAAKKP